MTRTGVAKAGAEIVPFKAKPSRARKAPSAPTSVVEQPLQFDFLTPDGADRTKAIGIWEVVPWGVIERPSSYSDRGKVLHHIDRDFSSRGITYHLKLVPAQIGQGGDTRQVFPGDREQLVELAIRQIAVLKRAYDLNKDSLVSMTIRVNDIFDELASVNHALSYDEILEAIEILSRTHLVVSRVMLDRDGDPYDTIMSSAIFPVVKLHKSRIAEKQSETRIYLQVNDMMSDAIRSLDFHNISYKTLMRLKPIGRMVYKWLYQDLIYGGEQSASVRSITWTQIQAQCGAQAEGARMDRVLRRVEDAFAQLCAEGILSKFERTNITEGTGGRPRFVDANFAMTISDAFFDQAVESRANVESMRAKWQAQVGGPAAPVDWVRPSASLRRRLVKSEQSALDL